MKQQAQADKEHEKKGEGLGVNAAISRADADTAFQLALGEQDKEDHQADETGARQDTDGDDDPKDDGKGGDGGFERFSSEGRVKGGLLENQRRRRAGRCSQGRRHGGTFAWIQGKRAIPGKRLPQPGLVGCRDGSGSKVTVHEIIVNAAQEATELLFARARGSFARLAAFLHLIAKFEGLVKRFLRPRQLAGHDHELHALFPIAAVKALGLAVELHALAGKETGGADKIAGLHVKEDFLQTLLVLRPFARHAVQQSAHDHESD